MAYRHFVCDSLRIITENTAKSVADGKYMVVRLSDILDPKPSDNRTSEEIVSAIRKKL